MLTRTLKDNRVTVLAIALIAALLLSACGIKVSSKTTADANFAGQRVFTLSIEKADIEDNAKGSIEEFDTAIKKHLPKSLTYSGAKDNGDTLSGTMTMAFSSKDDYIKKIGELAGDADGAADEISIVTKNTAFLQGFEMEEHYSAEDLFGWLADALVTEGIIAEDKRDGVIDSSADTYPEVIFNGKTYKSETTYGISINALTDNGMRGVLVTTSLLPDSYLQTYVQFLGDDESLTKEQLSALATHLKSNMPKDGKRVNENSDTVILKADSVEHLVSDLKKLLGDDSISLSVNTKQSDLDRTKIDTQLKGHLGCQGVCSPSDMSFTSVNWGFVVPPNSNDLGDTEKPKGEAAKLNGKVAYSFGPDVDIELQRDIELTSVIVDTERAMSGAYTTTITYELPASAGKSKADPIDLDAIFNPGDAGTMERKNSDKSTKYVVTFKGDDASDLSDKLDTYIPGSIAQEQTVSKGLFRNKYMVMVDVPLHVNSGTNPSLKTFQKSISFPFGYTVTEREGDGTIDGRTVTTTMKDHEVPAPVVTVKGPTTAQAIGAIVLLVLLIVLILVLVIFRKPIKKKMDERKQQAAQYQQAQAAVAGGPQPAGQYQPAQAGVAGTAGAAGQAGTTGQPGTATPATVAGTAVAESGEGGAPAAPSNNERVFEYDNTMDVGAPAGMATEDGWDPPYTSNPAPRLISGSSPDVNES